MCFCGVDPINIFVKGEMIVDFTVRINSDRNSLGQILNLYSGAR